LYDLPRTNVERTARVLEFARACPKLRKLVHISTTCVCGIQSGEIPEARLPKPAAFVNAYEQSKWEAEELVLDSSLPVEIVRLSIVAGSEKDGSVRRTGGLHHALFWLWKGLIPMMPGTPDTPLDLISTEYAARVVADCAQSAVESGRVLHACAGGDSPRLDELLEHAALVFAAKSNAWRHRSITPPMIVDADTFALFEQTVEQSGDALFRRVCRDSKSFLPGLLHRRRYANAKGRGLAGDPHGDWRRLTELVTCHVIDSRS
jgi:long-chain acyl-CoA synthetase